MPATTGFKRVVVGPVMKDIVEYSSPESTAAHNISS